MPLFGISSAATVVQQLRSLLASVECCLHSVMTCFPILFVCQLKELVTHTLKEVSGSEDGPITYDQFKEVSSIRLLWLDKVDVVCPHTLSA